MQRVNICEEMICWDLIVVAFLGKLKLFERIDRWNVSLLKVIA